VRRIALAVLILVVSGCASSGVIHNKPHAARPDHAAYAMRGAFADWKSGEITIALTFSGGGTRAAALAYGVLLELRDSRVTINGKTHRLLDDVHLISSVSGGSFTAAYYGLYGDRIFEDFEQKFLRQNIQEQLKHLLFNPLYWFTPKRRTERIMEYYQKNVFGNATFADMRKSGGPMVLINASDLSSGARISFVQEYFNLLCSDIDAFPVAKAVAASSAVPILFDPVVVENFDTCDTRPFIKLLAAARGRAASQEMIQAVRGLERLARDKKNLRYLHLVDGGITDNLGLRSFYEMIELSGGIKSFLGHMEHKPFRKSVVIVVDASNEPGYSIAGSRKEPGIEDTINAVSDIQLHRYNASTLELMQKSIRRWHNEMAIPGQDTDMHYIEVAFRGIGPAGRKKLIDQMPTGFVLSDKQVDAVIAAGRNLLRHHPEFQRLLASYRHQ